MRVTFKKTFFKDFKKLPVEIKTKIQQIVFVDIPNLERIYDLHNIKKKLRDTNIIIVYVLVFIALDLSMRRGK